MDRAAPLQASSSTPLAQMAPYLYFSYTTKPFLARMPPALREPSLLPRLRYELRHPTSRLFLCTLDLTFPHPTCASSLFPDINRIDRRPEIRGLLPADGPDVVLQGSVPDALGAAAAASARRIDRVARAGKEHDDDCDDGRGVWRGLAVRDEHD